MNKILVLPIKFCYNFNSKTTLNDKSSVVNGVFLWYAQSKED